MTAIQSELSRCEKELNMLRSGEGGPDELFQTNLYAKLDLIVATLSEVHQNISPSPVKAAACILYSIMSYEIKDIKIHDLRSDHGWRSVKEIVSRISHSVSQLNMLASLVHPNLGHICGSIVTSLVFDGPIEVHNQETRILAMDSLLQNLGRNLEALEIQEVEFYGFLGDESKASMKKLIGQLKTATEK